jgi:hypothetical protein
LGKWKGSSAETCLLRDMFFKLTIFAQWQVLLEKHNFPGKKLQPQQPQNPMLTCSRQGLPASAWIPLGRATC